MQAGVHLLEIAATSTANFRPSRRLKAKSRCKTFRSNASADVFAIRSRSPHHCGAARWRGMNSSIHFLQMRILQNAHAQTFAA
jgi:hypothetical protein